MPFLLFIGLLGFSMCGRVFLDLSHYSTQPNPFEKKKPLYSGSPGNACPWDHPKHSVIGHGFSPPASKQGSCGGSASLITPALSKFLLPSRVRFLLPLGTDENNRLLINMSLYSHYFSHFNLVDPYRCTWS